MAGRSDVASAENPYRNKAQRQAWEAGAQARRDGAAREDHPYDYLAPFVRAWRRGWDDAHEALLAERAAAQAVHRDPVATHRPPPRRSTRVEYVVPEDEDITDRLVYRQTRPVPCKYCRRVYLDDLKQAVIVIAINGQGESRRAYLSCRACGQDFSVPVEII